MLDPHVRATLTPDDKVNSLSINCLCNSALCDYQCHDATDNNSVAWVLLSAASPVPCTWLSMCLQASAA